MRAGSWRKGVLACDVSFLWGPWRRTVRDEFGALGGPSCAVSVLEPAIDLTTVSQPWPPQILHQAVDAASGRQLSGTGPDYESTQTIPNTISGGPDGPLAGHTLQFVASLISQGAQIVTIRQSDPFVLV